MEWLTGRVMLQTIGAFADRDKRRSNITAHLLEGRKVQQRSNLQLWGVPDVVDRSRKTDQSTPDNTAEAERPMKWMPRRASDAGG